MYDILIRNGLVVDGTGVAPRVADVAIQDGRIAAVAQALEGEAAEIIDAAGKIVTPGFIDVHTHYDGQVTWDEAMLPSSAHGVTTIIIGSCGIGFAPVRAGSEEWLIRLTEGVEDIPGSALSVGIPWGWTSFPDYLDMLGKRRYALNVAAHVPHSAVRAYVLGDRAARDEPATSSELEEMRAIVGESIRAGAIGVSTSRVSMHRGSDGGVVPGTRAPEEELLALGEAMRDAGGGVFQIIPSGVVGGVEGEEGENSLAGHDAQRDEHRLSVEIERMRRIHRKTGQPITFTFAESRTLGQDEYWRARSLIDEAITQGEKIFPQYSPRPVGMVTSLGSYHAFTARPSYKALAALPVEERARRMAQPHVKAAILGEMDDEDSSSSDPMQHVHKTFQKRMIDTYDLGGNPDFEPLPSESIVERARRDGRDPFDLLYDLLIQNDGRHVLNIFATNYLDGDLEKLSPLLKNESYLLGLGDAGAHVSFICDAGFPSFVLAHWGKTRTRGKTLPIEMLVRRMTSDAARVYRLDDRGVVAPGLRADLNVIDLDRLRLFPPHLAHDLPLGAQRFLQNAEGYEATIVNGVITRRKDQDTGARPGRLLRGRPAAALSSDEKRGATSTPVDA